MENILVVVKNITSKPTCKFIFIVFCLSIVHWFTIQIYIKMCIGTGVLGLLSSFISLGSPVCQFINFIQFELSKHYITIWAATGVSFLAWIFSILK